MESVHCDRLRENRCGLVLAIKQVEAVVDKLMTFKVLTILMKAEIIEKPRTSFDRVRELLDMLPRRGPQAYSLFCKALEECEETEAMTLLGLKTPTDKAQSQVTLPWLFFYGIQSPFSNFHPAVFTLDGVTFNCVEQCYMYSKAMYFGDDDSATRILHEAVPAKQKRLGRCVKGFTQTVWDTVSLEVMTKAITAKFSQNKDLKQRLIQSYPKSLAEASPYDQRWGIGMGVSHPNIDKPWTWSGKNKLGKALMHLRDTLLLL